MVKNGSVGVISGDDWLWNGGAVMLGFWVRLGEELGVVWMELEALDQMEWKRRKMSEFAEEEGEDWGLSSALDALSQDDQKKVLEGGDSG